MNGVRYSNAVAIAVGVDDERIVVIAVRDQTGSVHHEMIFVDIGLEFEARRVGLNRTRLVIRHKCGGWLVIRRHV